MLGRSVVFAPWGGGKYQASGYIQKNVFVKGGKFCPCLFSAFPNCPLSDISFEGLIPRVECSKALLECPSWEEEERMGA